MATGPQVDQEYNEPGNYTISLTGAQPMTFMKQ